MGDQVAYIEEQIRLSMSWRVFGPTIPRGPFTMDEYTDAILRYGHDPVLWWCDEHRHLAPGSVPCPACHERAEAERLRVERLIRDARRRAGHCARRPVWVRVHPSTRAVKRRAKRRRR